MDVSNEVERLKKELNAARVLKNQAGSASPSFLVWRRREAEVLVELKDKHGIELPGFRGSRKFLKENPEV